MTTKTPTPQSLIGSFVFRDEGDGCLTAKWINEGEGSPSTECCKLYAEQDAKSKFCGLYKTTWIQSGKDVEPSDLLIEFQGEGLYKLRWMRSNDHSHITFKGLGMLYDNLLVGAYWD